MARSAHTNVSVKDVPSDETPRSEGAGVALCNRETRHDRAIKKIMRYFIYVLCIMAVVPVVFIGHGIIKESQEHVNTRATDSAKATKPFGGGQENAATKGPLNTHLPFPDGGEDILPYTERNKGGFRNLESGAKAGSEMKTHRTWKSTMARGMVIAYSLAATIANAVYLTLCGRKIAALINIPVDVTAEPKRSAVLVASGLLLVVNWASITLDIYKSHGGFD